MTVTEQLGREMPLEVAFEFEQQEQAGFPDLPDEIPAWVLEDLPDSAWSSLFDAPDLSSCSCGAVPACPSVCSLSCCPTVDDVPWDALDAAEQAALSDALRAADPALAWPVSPEVAALQAAVAAVIAQDPTAQSPKVALADAEALLVVQQALRVDGLDRLVDVQDRELHELDGATSAREWLRSLQPDADPSDVTLALQSRHFGVLRSAVAGSEVSLAAAKKVTTALRRAGGWVDQRGGLIGGLPAEAVIAGVVRSAVTLISEANLSYAPGDLRLYALTDQAEQIIAGTGSELGKLEQAYTLLAQLVPLDRLTLLLGRLFHAMVPLELERQADAARAKRLLDLRVRPDGNWNLRAILTPEAGEYAWTALGAMLRKDTRNPLDTAAAEQLRTLGLDPYAPDTWPAELREQLLNQHPEADAAGLAPDVTPDRDGIPPLMDDPALPRGRGERLHDAFALLCQTLLDQGLGGTHHKAAVHINVTLTEPALTGQPGALPAVGDSGQSIPRSLLRRWWCDSSITAFILSRGGKALRAVHAGRTLTGQQRRALLIEQGQRCAVKTCRGHTREGPGHDLRPHHVRRWTDDQQTSIDDTVMICDQCHRDMHEGGKTLRLSDNRLINEQGWIDPITHHNTQPQPPPF